MTNKEKFLALVAKDDTNTAAQNEARIKNRAMLRASRNIAWAVLKKLDELGWSQKKLADELGVTPQQVQKIVKGRENLTLDTIVKLEAILDISILVEPQQVAVIESNMSVVKSNVVIEKNYSWADYAGTFSTQMTTLSYSNTYQRATQ